MNTPLDIYGDEIDDTMSLDGTMNTDGLDMLTQEQQDALASALGVDFDAIANSTQGDMAQWNIDMGTASSEGDNGN